MDIRSETIVGDIVKLNFKTAQIFDKHNIDFCCGGGISLGDACREAGINTNDILPQLEAQVSINDPDSKYIDSLDLNDLCDYIEKRHHTYVTENLPFLQEKLQKLCEVHGENHVELFQIKELFDGAAGNLSAHMKKEELVLFPYIRKMVKQARENAVKKSELGNVLEPIHEMEMEHQVEGERFANISKLSQNYSCPPDGCNTFKVTYQTLQDFENDLHRHIHLENNILFKKAVIFETELINGK